MLRYKTKTRPGLVALYDIRPGNGAGPFLQPRSPHGANQQCQSTEGKHSDNQTQQKIINESAAAAAARCITQ